MAIWMFSDTETTGVSPTDRIVEVAYVALDDNAEEIDRGEALINPGIPIPSGASAVNGITNKMVADASDIDQFMADHGYPFQDPDVVLVAHNVGFDYRYLSPFMSEHAGQMCTLRLAKVLYPGLDSYKLQALRYSLDLEGGEAHRASGDVDLMINLVLRMMADHEMDLYGLYALSQKPMEITTWPFGKFKDQPLRNADRGYVQWALRQDNLDADLRSALERL